MPPLKPDELEDRAKLYAEFYERSQRILALEDELWEWADRVGLFRKRENE
jgi:hypothetical protein